MKIPELKIGTNLDIVFENEINKSNAHFMKALVYDIEDRKIIISQTSPALNRSFLNRQIMVSFLSKMESRKLRFGFPAKLTDLIKDYEIARQQIVEALVLTQYKESEPIDFRMYYRINPPAQSDINLFYKEEKVNVINISVGGAKVICPQDNLLRPSDKVKFKLVIGRLVFNLENRVCDVAVPDDSANKNIQHVSVEFEHNNKQLESALSKAILEIERQLICEGKL